MKNPMYVEYADLYDQFYRQKDYAKEAAFLKQILKHPPATVLDVGCGTGSHMALLEKVKPCVVFTTTSSPEESFFSISITLRKPERKGKKQGK